MFTWACDLASVLPRTDSTHRRALQVGLHLQGLSHGVGWDLMYYFPHSSHPVPMNMLVMNTKASAGMCLWSHWCGNDSRGHSMVWVQKCCSRYRILKIFSYLFSDPASGICPCSGKFPLYLLCRMTVVIIKSSKIVHLHPVQQAADCRDHNPAASVTYSVNALAARKEQ